MQYLKPFELMALALSATALADVDPYALPPEEFDEYSRDSSREVLLQAQYKF